MSNTCRPSYPDRAWCCWWRWRASCSWLLLLFCVMISSCLGQTTNGTVRILPHFTHLPPPVSYFIAHTRIDSTPSAESLDLICRAWPPNARVYWLATHPTHPPTECQPPVTTGSGVTCIPGFGTLLPVPPGLGIQRYGLLADWQIASTDFAPTHSPTPNTVASRSRAHLLLQHESLADAVRERPAAGPNDEVAVRLTVTSLSEVRQLESVRLHCLVTTPFGHLLSRPFRILPTSLGDFPTQSHGPRANAPLIRTVEILVNNIAAIDCPLPLNSHPPPMVHFELNGTLINDAALQGNKYRMVWLPDGQNVNLLIHKVESHDHGNYRCSVTNPLSGEKKYSPEVTQLKVIVPTSPVELRITVPLAPNTHPTDRSGTHSPARSREIVVNEGQNVSLFCIIQGAPPSPMTTYPFSPNATDHNRFQSDSKFGVLQITNVQPRDAGFYVCNARHISSTAQLHVKPRVHLLTQPEDVRVTRLGTTAQFKCTSSDPAVKPFWLFNGQPRVHSASGTETVLDIANVTTQHLGVYQCVLQRDRSDSATAAVTDEWISASAILALQSDQVVRTANELAQFTPQTSDTMAQSTPEVTTSELIPQAQVLYDNLAIYMVWQPLHTESSSAIDPPTHTVHYRVEYSVQIIPTEERTLNTTTATPTSNTWTALVGLVGHAAVRWSEPQSLEQQTEKTVAYVTDNVLQPSKRYRFRVIAVHPDTGVPLAPPSDWSRVVSTEHISPVEPPQIKMVRPLSQGRVHLRWMFDSGSSPTITGRSVQNVPLHGYSAFAMPSTSNAILQLEPDASVFVADHFLVLARPLIKPKADSSDPFKFGTYLATQVNGSDAREGILTGLNASASYQVIVYGVRGEGDRRQITRYSKAAFVNLAAADHVGSYSVLRALTTNRLMYLILGGIAAMMFLVVFVFILLCLCRQQRERHVNNRRKQQNGFARGYKDTSHYPPVSTAEASGGGAVTVNGQSHSGAGTISNHGAGAAAAGTPAGMLMMNNLQCSGFSDHSASNQHGPPMLQQQHADQYNASLSKEMMMMQQQQQQQQRSLLGSQMHLQQQQQQQPFYPPHHQSHHSLLLPSGVMMSPSGPGAAVYQTGTLPGGPRYLRQQTYAGHQFGSQQPLNRAMTPANMLDMTEFYPVQSPPQGSVYAHQQPQLPPVPHPQTADLPPMHGGIPPPGTTMGHPQMVYYPGPMTPNGTSLKREPPTGGSFQDASAYGTLLQRGQLTGSMINDRSSMISGGGGGGGGSMRPMSHHVNTVYYPHGSQQTLHMMQYPSGMATPQAAHAAVYSSRQPQSPYFAQQQQQQQQYPGYYGQPVLQHPDGLGHTLHGFGPTDGESIYSYFSQQEMGQPNAHQPLNPLPEENQMHVVTGSGYVESGMQTAELINGQDGAANGSSPAGGGSHRHHRRRRRKQQQQQQQQRQASEGLNGMANDSTDALEDGPPMSEQPGDAQLDDPRPVFEQELSGHKRHHSLSGAGTYSDTDPLSAQHSFASPQAYHHQHHHQQQQQQFSSITTDSGRSGYMRYDSPQRGQISPGPLPPPNQPPPPPPPPAVAMGLASPNLANGIPGDQPGAYSTQPGMYPPPPPPPPGGDSLSRRIYSGAHGPPGSLVVGPPPRMRDYSEYGIPRGIGLPPTPSGIAGGGGGGGGGQPLPSHHSVLMGGSNTAHVTPGNMMYVGRYREGQA